MSLICRPFCSRLLQMGVYNAELFTNLGLCCFFAQQYDMTLNCFERALALASDENMADVWYNIGHVAVVNSDSISTNKTIERIYSTRDERPVQDGFPVCDEFPVRVWKRDGMGQVFDKKLVPIHLSTYPFSQSLKRKKNVEICDEFSSKGVDQSGCSRSVLLHTTCVENIHWKCPNLKLQLLVSTPLLIWPQKNVILYPIL